MDSVADNVLLYKKTMELSEKTINFYMTVLCVVFKICLPSDQVLWDLICVSCLSW